MKNFKEWKSLFDAQNLYEFNHDESGVIWLKLKSLIRTDILKEFIADNNITLSTKGIQNNFKELYELYQNGIFPSEKIDDFSAKYNKNEIENIEKIFETIKLELYKLTEFAWGGDATNSLDKQIVSYVKNIYLYDEIINKIENDIAINTKNYTLNSWYNNWTSVLTEHIFKKHSNVISAVGKIKSVDFFIKNIPVDLKITYFPKAFLKLERKERGLLTEITFLKRLAKEYKINFNKDDSEDIIRYQILEQAKDANIQSLNDKVLLLDEENKSIIKDIINDKHKIIKWLYEEQGELRFGAENRLFIILIDINNMNHAWKLKRNFALLESQIKNYLDSFTAERLLGNEVIFNFKEKEYKTLSDALFITTEL